MNPKPSLARYRPGYAFRLEMLWLELSPPPSLRWSAWLRPYQSFGPRLNPDSSPLNTSCPFEIMIEVEARHKKRACHWEASILEIGIDHHGLDFLAYTMERGIAEVVRWLDAKRALEGWEW